MQRPARFIACAALCAIAGGAALPLAATAAPAPDSAAVQSPVESQWHPQQIRYSYTAFTTAYDCDAAAAKIKDILTTLGAHPQTKVSATGCDMHRPSRMFFVSITTATPVAVTQSSRTQPDRSQQQLIERLGGASAVAEPFTAAWQTVDLSNDRKLNLQPGDCELMEGLRNHVLPKIGVKVISDKVQCYPNALSIQTPELEVSALVPVGDAAAKQRAVS